MPPAIAIDQSNPVRNSRSTVGTMSELNDHLKLLYARAAQLYDRQTALPVRADHPDTLYTELLRRSAQEHARTGQEPRLLLTFPVQLPASSSAQEVEQWLSASGYTRVLGQRQQAGSGPDSAPVQVLDVVADRLLLSRAERARVLEAIERCLEHGAGRLNVYLQEAPGADSAPLAHSTSAADSSLTLYWARRVTSRRWPSAYSATTRSWAAPGPASRTSAGSTNTLVIAPRGLPDRSGAPAAIQSRRSR